MGKRRIHLLKAVVLWVAAVVLPRECSPADFLRGDFQQSGEVDIGDAIRIFGFAFDEVPFDDPCTAAADVNADHRADVTDMVLLLEYLFQAGKPPAPPFPEPGPDPTPDPSGQLDCTEYGPLPALKEPRIILDVVSKGEYDGGTEYPAMVRLATTVEGVEAWSFGLIGAPDLCQIFSATTAGTVLENEKGFGFSRTERVDGTEGVGIVSAGAILFEPSVYLPSDGSPQDVLAILWKPTGPFANKVCFSCVLSFVDGLQGTGAPVKVRAVRDNVSVIPAAPDAVIDSCAFVTPLYLPGDCNMDGVVNITDALFLLNYLFGDGSAPPRPESCDADGSGSLQISDAIRILNYLFSGGAPPVPVF